MNTLLFALFFFSLFYVKTFNISQTVRSMKHGTKRKECEQDTENLSYDWQKTTILPSSGFSYE